MGVRGEGGRRGRGGEGKSNQFTFMVHSLPNIGREWRREEGKKRKRREKENLSIYQHY